MIAGSIIGLSIWAVGILFGSLMSWNVHEDLKVVFPSTFAGLIFIMFICSAICTWLGTTITVEWYQ